MIRRAQLSKDVTPVARDGAFHWSPADADGELRARFVERMRGIAPPAALFELAPGHAAWATLFAGIAPIDQRHYTGLALAIADDPDAGSAALLATLDDAPGVAHLAEAAAGLLGDGVVRVADPTAPGLAAAIARVLAVLPRAMRMRTIVGAVRRGAAVIDGLPAVIAHALVEPGSRAAIAWSVCRELADRRGVDCRALAASDPAGDLVATLHAWGRGTDDPDAAADALADRVLATALAGGDPSAPIGEARWSALLPARRRTALLAAVADRGATLRALVESHHA